MTPSETNFYRDRLSTLFFAGLNNPQSLELMRDNPTLHSAIGDVPFLNGGLFEETGLDRRTVSAVPDGAIAPLLTDLFDRYNFTVMEATPLDAEVAVDPEMLERVRNADSPRPTRMSSSTYRRLEYFYLNLAAMIANTVELKRRLTQGRKRRPREQKDAFAYHGRENARIIRAFMEVVGEAPPMESIYRRADQPRFTRARAEVIQIIDEFEHWYRRRFSALRQR